MYKFLIHRIPLKLAFNTLMVTRALIPHYIILLRGQQPRSQAPDSPPLRGQSACSSFAINLGFYVTLFNLERYYTYPCGWLGADVNCDSSYMSYLDSGPHHVSMFNPDLTTTDYISAKFHPSK